MGSRARWTRRRVDLALAALAVLAVGCGVGPIFLLAAMLSVDINGWSR